MRFNLSKLSSQYSFSTNILRLPAFPRTLTDLETSVKTCLSMKDELKEGSTDIIDEEYFKRKQEVIETSATYHIDQQTSLPIIEFTLDENRLWYKIYRELVTVQERGAPHQIYSKFRVLEKGIGMGPRKIPQL